MVTIVTKHHHRIPVRVPSSVRRDDRYPDGFVNGEDWVITSSMNYIPGSIGWGSNQVCYSPEEKILRLEHAETGDLIFIPRDEISHMEQKQ